MQETWFNPWFNPGRSHMPRSSSAPAHEPSVASSEPALWSPGAAAAGARLSRACAAQRENPPRWEACALRLRSSPHSPQPEKGPRGMDDPARPKYKEINRAIHVWRKSVLFSIGNTTRIQFPAHFVTYKVMEMNGVDFLIRWENNRPTFHIVGI